MRHVRVLLLELGHFRLHEEVVGGWLSLFLLLLLLSLFFGIKFLAVDSILLIHSQALPSQGGKCEKRNVCS